jgi:hypothetical protein
MDKATLMQVLEMVTSLRTEMYLDDLREETDYTMGKVVALDQVIESIRDAMEDNNERNVYPSDNPELCVLQPST